MTTMDQNIIDRCNRYLLEEPNAALRSEIERLMDQSSPSAHVELGDRLLANLSFGTAGIRGKMEAGYNRMNMVSVYRFAYAIGIELLNEGGSHRSVVIGFDARHNSKDFAGEISLVLRAMGFLVHLFRHACPTPLGAFATRNLNAAAGIMVTASHNPPWDNGIKVFGPTSAQAHGCFLKQIEERMTEALIRLEFHRQQGRDLGDARLQYIGDEICESYLRQIRSTQFLAHENFRRDCKIVYTPLHGVGKNLFMRALSQEGFVNVTVVPEQAEPDGDFKTVAFPNPEEAHTLDLAHRLGEVEHCDMVLANDPDADRLQVSCPDENSVMQKLSGNEIGIIFGYFALLKAKSSLRKPLCASSIVSSRMLKVMCAQMNAHYVDALTGFSNIVQSAIKKESESDAQFIFAYEEAIGFLIGRVVLDKDGIHAGVRFMEIMSYLNSIGKSIWQLLDELYLKFGLFVNTSFSWRFDGADSPTNMKKVMQKVRTIEPGFVAQLLSKSECVRYDLSDEQERGCYQGLCSDVVIFEIENSGRIIVRPSGTEPKIKFYLELWDQATDRQSLSMKRSKLEEMMVTLKREIEQLFSKGA